jgi:hypothetical protein
VLSGTGGREAGQRRGRSARIRRRRSSILAKRPSIPSRRSVAIPRDSPPLAVSRFPCEVSVFRLEGLSVWHSLDDNVDLIERKWLGQVVIRAKVYGLDRRGQRGITCDDDDPRGGICVTPSRRQVHPHQ